MNEHPTNSQPLTDEQKRLLYQAMSDAIEHQAEGAVGCSDCDATDPLTDGACVRHRAAYAKADDYEDLTAVLIERGCLLPPEEEAR